MSRQAGPTTERPGASFEARRSRTLVSLQAAFAAPDAIDDRPAGPGAHAMRRASPGRLVALGETVTSLGPPSRRRGAVRRDRLIALVRSSDAPIVTIVAPAGYGKTTLLAQLARAEDRAVIWVALHRRDSDPTALMRHLVAAFSAAAGRGDRTRVPGRTRSLDRLMASLAPFALFLDDVDCVSGGEGAAVVEVIAERLPPGSRLLMASRSEPPIAMARARVTGTLLELDRARLAFDDAEAAAFARGLGDRFDPEAMRAFGRRAEGWVAGMMLGVLATQRDTDTGLDSIGGDDRFIADYLEMEVLHGLTADERTFLRRTAFLDRLSGPLCDAVLGRAGSSSVLEDLDRTNRFLVPLDHRREWYRHHLLLRGMLRSQLDRTEHDRVPTLARRAATWFEANGHMADALDAARLAGDTQMVAGLLRAHGREVLESGAPETLHASLQWFEASGALREHATPTLVGSWLWLYSGHGAIARRWMSTLAHPAGERPGALEQEPSGPPEALIRCALAEGGADQMLLDARSAAQQVPDHSPWRAEAMCMLGVALSLAGQGDESRTALDAAIEASGAGTALARATALAFRGLDALRRGDRQAAATDSADARDALSLTGLADTPVSSIVDALAARVALARGDRGRARVDLAHCRSVRRELRPGLPWLVAQADIELARASLGLGDRSGSRSLLRGVDLLFRRIPALGRLQDDAREIARQADMLPVAAEGASALTAAESRVLRYLTTHLSFPEIAARLVVSQNTVKSQVMSIYRKLDATSRAGAVEHARSLGLLDAGADQVTAGPDLFETVDDADATLPMAMSR
ncbi:MAG: LuxR C-terminal-related transcriptional regulator [Candidatus Limnocylindrales bacterium]